ncbi:MAG: hypothetical protein HOJ57_14745 [Lentisphaerae bacterium]|jgi:hypothetical protein|nr:hypothetical protein [Lentisphaerota bacterium]MBT4817429.1 hypothetical protein [Lentisphaerota bacterium]MBT5607195.1 hypothetical protein [Lentisphaerota bacterium]MBT7062006.1 hypothetical protein [Lentisphaerota bacterium]
MEQAQVLPTFGCRKEVLLSETGGDRATAYTMSNKILHVRDKLLCSWLDSRRLNHWAIVNPVNGSVEQRGTFPGQMADNHCGMALAVMSDGTIHALSGAHHGGFAHYGLATGSNWSEWQRLGMVGRRATYPSLAVDPDDTLHFCYRSSCSGGWELLYQRLSKGGVWTQPVPLVRNSYPGYIYWTNSLTTGPDGRLHLFFQNPFKPSAKTRYYGAGYLVSADGGRSWRQQDDGAPIEPPIEVLAAHRIEGKEINEAHIVEELVPDSFRLSHYYHGIHLSNSAVDGKGRPWVVLHRVQKEATLYHLEDGEWVGCELLPIVQGILPRWRIHTQSSLVVSADSTAHLALVVAPGDKPGWGPSEAEIIRLQLKIDGRVRKIGLVDRPNPQRARWLPSLEHRVLNAGSSESALLFTDGINAGGAAANQNDVSTKVRIQLW